ncbi:MAG: TRAP transporter large permease subunit [Desulfobacteraceae bacterium]|nr:TRAP transporter large permease subunit [Desulfobacteraceae bacterium]
MEIWLIILLLIGGLILFLAMGLPIAFAFFLINFIGAYIVMGGIDGVSQAVQQIFSSLTTFSIAPVPLFVLMGELLLHTGIAQTTLNVLDKFIGKIPGRLSLSVISGGALFSTLTGSTIANTAMLGEIMVPEMRHRGYKDAMILGPIVGVGGLAMLIPPSTLAIVYASLAQISVAKVLMGGALPGLMLALLYAAYVLLRCRLNPDIAPAYDISHISWSEKLNDLAKYLAPLIVIFLMVLGVIFLGIATPSEAAATGVIGAMILAAAYRRLNLEVLKQSLRGTLHITVMIFMIIAASKTYSAILAFSGATTELVGFVANMDVNRYLVLIGMMLIILILGTFMEQVSMMMITIPIYMPVINTLGFDPIWFAILMLLNLEMAMSTPPFGILLFVMKGSMPGDTKMINIIAAAFPFLICDLIVLIILIIFPKIVMLIPSIM